MTSLDKIKANSNNVRYGQSICIQSFSQSHPRCLLAARGKHSSEVFFLKENTEMMGKYHLNQDLGETSFLIYPKLSFEANLQLEESKQGDLKRNVYVKRKENEDLLNQTKIKESRGQIVKLGDIIQLFHPVTKLYLEVSIIKAELGDHNEMSLTSKNSTQVQFKIGSPLTFRKEGTNIGLGDEVTLISVTDKTIVCPTEEDLVKQLKMTLKSKDTNESWLFKDKEIKINIAQAGEEQTAYDLIQAGNMAAQSFTGIDYLNTYRIQSLEIEEIGDQTGDDFQFGDIIYIAKLDSRGKRNLMFVESNISSLKNTALFQVPTESEYSNLINYEHFFQIIPTNPSSLGEFVSFDESNQCRIQLKHLLTGKFVFYNTKTDALELIDDFGAYKEHIKSNKSSMQSKYKDGLSDYNDILEDENIMNKEEVISKKFTSAQIKMFKETDTILEGENRFIHQYQRDSSFILESVNSTGSSMLQQSTFFSLSTFYGDKLRVEQDFEEETIQKLFKPVDKQNKKDYKNFERTFDNTVYYNLEFPTKCDSTDQPDFFYFEKVGLSSIQVYQNVIATLPSLGRYAKGSLSSAENLQTLKLSLEFIESKFFSHKINRKQFQTFLRQSTVIEILMKIIELVGESKINDQDFNLIRPFFLKIVKILSMFNYKNKISAAYLYQWKKLFSSILSEKMTFGKNQIFELDQFVSDVFEQTGFYGEYINIKLEPICRSLVFTNYNYDKLRLLLTIVKSSKRLKSDNMDQIIVDTVVSQKYSSIMFFPLKYNQKKEIVEVIQPDLTQLLKEHSDLRFKSQFKVGETIFELTPDNFHRKVTEFDYITDLVNTAVKLLEISPSKFSQKIAKFFPPEACLHIIYDRDLPGKLRGSFLQVYKCIYINSMIRESQLTTVKSNITLNGIKELKEEIESEYSLDFRQGILVEKRGGSPQKKKNSPTKNVDAKEESMYDFNKSTTFKLQKKNRINEIRNTVLMVGQKNLIDLVVATLDQKGNSFTESTMQFVKFLITNGLLKDKELNKIDEALKNILLVNGNLIPAKKVKQFNKKFKNKSGRKDSPQKKKKQESTIITPIHQQNKSESIPLNSSRINMKVQDSGQTPLDTPFGSPEKGMQTPENKKVTEFNVEGNIARSESRHYTESDDQDISLQQQIWLPNLFSCLIEIENTKNHKRRNYFLTLQSKKLKIDSESMLQNYGSFQIGEIEQASKTLEDEDYTSHQKKQMQIKQQRILKITEDRQKTKVYMDELTNSDPRILSLVVDLINPELEDLTEIMLQFVEIQLRRDELIMKIYKNKYELINPSPRLKSDFFKFYDMSMILKRTMIRIEQLQNEKLYTDSMNKYTELFDKLSSILSNVYIFMNQGDQMKKLEAYLTNLEDGDILEDTSLNVEVPNASTKTKPKKESPKKKSKKSQEKEKVHTGNYF